MHTLKKFIISVCCLSHILTLFWWTLPQSFNQLFVNESGRPSLTNQILQSMVLEPESPLYAVLQIYIDLTGNQQYWDFFAPHSPKIHQYLSVCDSIKVDAESERIYCQGKTLFTNLDDNFTEFNQFGNDSSRWYRLSENLIKLNHPVLLVKFTHFFRNRDASKQAYLIAHFCELFPDINDLPREGYRSDKLLVTLK